MCRVAHSVLEHRLGATSVVAFITKRTGLLRQKEVGSFFWSAGIGGGRRPQCLEASVRWRIGEVPRIPLPHTSVNKGQLRTVGAPAHEPLWRALSG